MNKLSTPLISLKDLFLRILFLTITMLCTIIIYAEPQKDYYLFVYFTGNATEQQQICYAISNNGLDFTPINEGNPVISSDTIAITKGVRDPHLLRGDEGWFYLVATDMDWTKGKWSNRGIIIMRSRNLIDWEHHAIDFHQRFASEDAAKANAVWAPQTIWDESVQKYMIYFSLHSEEGGPYPKDAVYYTYANKDFSDVECSPKLLFSYPYPTIDTDIVQDESGTYHLFFNTWGGPEGLSRRQYIFTDIHDQKTWKLLEGRMQPNDISSEGSCAYPLAEGGWILVYDCFKAGFCQFCKSDDLINFELIKSTATSGTFTPRHGTVIRISQEEYEELNKRFGKSDSITE